MGEVINFQNQFAERDTGKRINQYDIIREIRIGMMKWIIIKF